MHDHCDHAGKSNMMSRQAGNSIKSTDPTLHASKHTPLKQMSGLNIPWSRSNIEDEKGSPELKIGQLMT